MLTPSSRFWSRLWIIQRAEDEWTQAHVAAGVGVSRSTVVKWWRWYKAEGIAGLRDRSSRPGRTPPQFLTLEAGT